MGLMNRLTDLKIDSSLGPVKGKIGRNLSASELSSSQLGRVEVSSRSMRNRFVRRGRSSIRRVAGLVWRCARTVLVFAAALGPAAPPPPPPPPVKIKEDEGDAELDEER